MVNIKTRGTELKHNLRLKMLSLPVFYNNQLLTVTKSRTKSTNLIVENK